MGRALAVAVVWLVAGCGGRTGLSAEPPVCGGWLVDDLTEGWFGVTTEGAAHDLRDTPIDAAQVLYHSNGWWHGFRVNSRDTNGADGTSGLVLPITDPDAPSMDPRITLSSIAVGPDNNEQFVAVAELEGERGIVYFTSREPRHAEIVEAVPDAQSLSIAADQGGYVAIGYCTDTCEAVALAQPHGGVWMVERQALGGPTSDLSPVVLDEDHEGHFCASVRSGPGPNARLVYAAHADDGWSVRDLGAVSEPVARCSVAVAADGAYVAATASAGVVLMHVDPAGNIGTVPIEGGAARGAVTADEDGTAWLAVWREGTLAVGRLPGGPLREIGSVTDVVEIGIRMTRGMPYVVGWAALPDRTFWAHPDPFDTTAGECVLTR